MATLIALGPSCGNGGDASAPTRQASLAATGPYPGALSDEEAELIEPEPADFGGVTDDAVRGETSTQGSGGHADSTAAPAEATTAVAVAASAEAASSSPLQAGRDIVYEASLSVQADDVVEAGRQAVKVVEGRGGIVFARTTDSKPVPRATLTFRVSPADFPEVLDELARVGEPVTQSMTADDVTERVVDLDSRIATAEASVTRLRGLLAEASDTEDLAQIERELLDRETTLETLRAQLRSLRDRVSLATITMTIEQSPGVLPESGIAVRAWVSDEDDDPCLGDEYVSVEPDATAHFCVEVENTGASALTDVRLDSDEIRFNEGAVEIVQGGFERVEPGKLLVATFAEPVVDARLAGRVITRGYGIGFEARAVPLDAAGDPLQEVSGESFVTVQARADESLPGFRDSVSEGAGMLASIVAVIVVVVGTLVPFLPFIAVSAAGLLWLIRRRRRRRRRSRQAVSLSPGAGLPVGDLAADGLDGLGADGPRD